MSETSTKCLRCGKSDPDLRVDCVAFSRNHEKVTKYSNGVECRTVAVRDQEVTGYACSGCAAKALKHHAVFVAAGVMIFAAVVFALIIRAGLQAPHLAFLREVPLPLQIAVAALVTVAAGVLAYRRSVSLPVAFGVARLLRKKDPDYFEYLPCELSLYPGATDAEKKKAFVRICGNPEIGGSVLAKEIWEQHIR